MSAETQERLDGETHLYLNTVKSWADSVYSCMRVCGGICERELKFILVKALTHLHFK